MTSTNAVIPEGKKIILASGSPRRKELLAGLGVEFTVDTGNSFEEVFSPDTPHRQVPVIMSEGKSFGFHRDLSPDEILITSDTMVLCDLGEKGSIIMGKPHNRQEAIYMLQTLSGREHEVITGVSIRTTAGIKTECDTTFVKFRKLDDSEIEFYVDTYKPFDKAGAYGIQEWIGYIGIESITGSYFNVMGFPTHLVYKMLKES